MRLKYFYCVLLITLYVTICLFSPVYASDSIEWYSYVEGKVLARVEKKKVFLHFYADWCVFCAKMNKETFRDAAVLSYLEDNFISVRVDIDKERPTTEKYGVRGVPANWFLTETGQPIINIPGYIAPDALMSLLKEVNGISGGG